MRSKTLQITWHTRGTKNDPILSIDFHPTLPILATAGADYEVKLWRLVSGEVPAAAPTAAASSGGAAGGAPAAGAAAAAKQGPVVQFMATLEGHELAVNAVRWSPNGASFAAEPATLLRQAACPALRSSTHLHRLMLFSFVIAQGSASPQPAMVRAATLPLGPVDRRWGVVPMAVQAVPALRSNNAHSHLLLLRKPVPALQTRTQSSGTPSLASPGRR
jgi:hypothetical protein